MAELAREFEPTAQTIQDWVYKANLPAVTPEMNLDEREELKRLRKENRDLRVGCAIDLAREIVKILQRMFQGSALLGLDRGLELSGAFVLLPSDLQNLVEYRIRPEQRNRPWHQCLRVNVPTCSHWKETNYVFVSKKKFAA